MQNPDCLTIVADRRKVTLDVRTILYINMHENVAEIHTSGGAVYNTRITLEKLEAALGSGFIKPHRSRLVSVMAIHRVTKRHMLLFGLRGGVTKCKDVARGDDGWQQTLHAPYIFSWWTTVIIAQKTGKCLSKIAIVFCRDM